MKGSRSFNSHVLHQQYMALREDVWSVPHALLQNRHRTFSPGLWASRGKVGILPHLLFPFYGAMLSRGYLATPGPLEKVTSFPKCLWESLGPFYTRSGWEILQFALVVCWHIWVVSPEVQFDCGGKSQNRHLSTFSKTRIDQILYVTFQWLLFSPSSPQLIWFRKPKINQKQCTIFYFP